METENIIGSQSEMKNTISEMKSTLEGINKLDEAEDQISNLEDGVERTLNQNNKNEESKKNEGSLRSL